MNKDCIQGSGVETLISHKPSSIEQQARSYIRMPAPISFAIAPCVATQGETTLKDCMVGCRVDIMVCGLGTSTGLDTMRMNGVDRKSAPPH